MNNKVLALFGLVPMWLSFMAGFMEGYTGEVIASDGFYMFMGVLTMTFVTWGLVRLYKTK